MINPLVLVLALICAVPLLCRLTSFNLRDHIPRAAVLHVLLAIAVAWSAVKAWQWRADFGDLCTILSALTWIRISYHSWRLGVPDQYHRRRPGADEPQMVDISRLGGVWGRGPK